VRSALLFAHRRENEAALLRAGIDVVARVGVDAASVGKVADEADLTRPTFYAYFESMPGLLASIWLELGPKWLGMLSDVAFDPAGSEEIEARTHRALTDILAAAHRVPEVLEVVQPTVAQWWTAVRSHGQFHAEKTSWLVAQRIGSMITGPIDPLVESSSVIAGVLAALPDAAAMPDGRESWDGLPEVGGFEAGMDGGGDRVILAAIDVIARSGVRGASMARIARRAQVSTGSIYPRYPSIDDIIDRSFEHAIRAIVEANFLRVKEAGSPFDYGLSVLAGLQPARQTWRDFRIEIHLEARHRPSLAERLLVSIRETNEVLIDSSRFLRELPREVVGPLPYLIHGLGIGLSVLQNAGVPVDRLDHPRLSVEVGELLRNLPR
jgi:AcrR family transcriptional regulator